MNTNKSSLALRLGLIITAIILVGFVAICIVVTSMVRDSMYDSAIDRTDSAMVSAADQIDIMMERSQEEIENFLAIVEPIASSGKRKDSLVRLTRLFLTENGWAKTAKIAFLPTHSKEGENYLAYISHRDKENHILDSKFTKKEDYATWDWFVRATKSTTSGWSEPFYNHTCDAIVNTFFCHIKDSQSGEVIAIWAVDVEFIRIKDLLADFLPFHGAFGYILSKEGRFLAHPELECRLKKVDELDDKFKTPAEMEIFSMALAGKHDNKVVEINGDKALVMVSPLEELGGSLAVVCPFSDVFSSAEAVRDSIQDEILIALFLVSGLILLIIYIVMKPLRGFSRAVRAVAEANFEVEIPAVRGNDELSDFHDAIIYLQNSLKDNIEKLTVTTASKARIESEIGVARGIQQGLLPTTFSFREYPCLDLYAKLQDAREVGGDLYDFFIRDGKLFFIVGDVSGKGVPASLVMAITCRVFRVVASREDSPELIASMINQTIATGNERNMFVTAFIGALNLEDGVLTYANAGHNPPLVIGPEYSRYLQMQPNVPLGVFSDYKYSNESITLEGQEALLLYTDGVIEAENQKGELFGADALLGFAFGASFSLSKEIVTALYDQVSSFANGAPQSDDIAVFCIRGAHGQNGLLGSLTLENNLNESRTLKPFVDKIASRLGIEEMEAGMINLALEEVVVNAIEYAYPSQDKGEIYIHAYMEEGSLCFEVMDAGIPFDPTSVPEIDTMAPANERTPGGLGVHLAREVFPTIEYQRIGKENHLTLKKRCQVA